jgi:hypothetical protein
MPFEQDFSNLSQSPRHIQTSRQVQVPQQIQTLRQNPQQVQAAAELNFLLESQISKCIFSILSKIPLLNFVNEVNVYSSN